MTETEADLIIRRIYWLALGFGLMGFVIYANVQGLRPAAGFALGAVGSIGNLWLFERITQSIVYSRVEEPVKKPWQAGIFVTRYIIMLAVGYAIVKTLGVNALAVILGLLVSTAAVVTSTIVELLQSFFVSRSSH